MVRPGSGVGSDLHLRTGSTVAPAADGAKCSWPRVGLLLAWRRAQLGRNPESSPIVMSPHYLDTMARGHTRRARRLMVLVVFVFLGYCFRLVHLQLMQGGTLRAASERNFVRTEPIPTDRGSIFDRNGRLLAFNRPSFDLYVTPGYVNDVDALIEGLRSILDLDELDIVALRDRITEPRGMWRYRALRVKRDVDRRRVAQIEALRATIEGMSIQVEYQRAFPQGEIGAHLLGYLGRPTASELGDATPGRYRADSMLGRVGLERRFESVLAGVEGFEQYVVDARGGRLPVGHVLDTFRRTVDRRAPEPGHDLVLTIDRDVQQILYDGLRGYESGGAVVVDPRDGTVIGMVSKPSFDPNEWSGRLTARGKQAIDENPYHPMLDKTVQSYFPGSVYKIVTAWAGLEEGAIEPDTLVDSPGYYEFGNRKFHCHNRSGFGKISVGTALAGSSDVFFYKLGERLGIDTLAKYGRQFGFGERTGLGINSESRGLVPTRAWHDKKTKGGYQYGLALSTAIGQGDVRASPLQVALAFAAVANGGTLYAPRVIDRIVTPAGRVTERIESRTVRQLNMRREHLNVIQTGLERVVSDRKRGTGRAAAVRVGRVSGKSGTAQVRRIIRGRNRQRVKRFTDRDHAWFVAYAPSESPRLVVVIFLEHGGAGGRNAAPIARHVIESYHEQIEPVFSAQASNGPIRTRRVQ